MAKCTDALANERSTTGVAMWKNKVIEKCDIGYDSPWALSIQEGSVSIVHEVQ